MAIAIFPEVHYGTYSSLPWWPLQRKGHPRNTYLSCQGKSLLALQRVET